MARGGRKASGAPKSGADVMRPLALKLPEAAELPHFGFPSFRVRGKIFATARLDRPLGMVKLPPEVQQAVIAEHPDAFSPAAGAWGRGGSTMVATDKVPCALLEDVLVTAWASAAPRALAAQHAARLKRG
jgi:hypothetical protein